MKNIFFAIIALAFLSISARAEFKQEPLPYSYDALEPFIDAQTMEIHYSKHHLAYINNLNAALKAAGMENKTDLTEIIKNISKYNTAVRNNGGGHFNHTFFWKCLTPNKDTAPSEKLKKAIESTFGTIEAFKADFNKQGLSRFGSGWVWLIVTPEKKLSIVSTPNQDNPLMDDATVKGTPILAVDVWEHAYYLKYQNRRGDYLNTIWTIINWDQVNKLYESAL
jgi:Fe-Mn family superoxide dismutase